MSVCAPGTCPHGRGMFVWLGDGPELGDRSAPEYGRYPWVHHSTKIPGHLVVCELMPFATPEEAGEVCACGHPSHEHQTTGQPIHSGEVSNPRPCACGCPDFRHRAEDLARWHANPAENARAAARSPLESPATPVEADPAAGQLTPLGQAA